MATLITRKIIHLKGEPGNTEWWTHKDWEAHAKRVEELKSKGEYLQPEELTVSMVHHPLFDGDIKNFKNNPNYTITEI